MNKLAFLVLFALLKISILHAQQHPGFFFQDSATTSVNTAQARSNGKIITAVSTSKTPWVSSADSTYHNISVVNDALNRRDTTLWIPNNLSGKYNIRITHQLIVNDTSYFLGLCWLRNKNTYATNLFTTYLTPQNNFGPVKYLFNDDTVGTFPYWGTTELAYDQSTGLFELMEMRYDSISSSRDLFLLKFDKQGNLNYFKTWDYTYQWSSRGLKPNDFQKISNTEYLVVQSGVYDNYFFADLNKSEIDTGYFTEPIHTLISIIEKKNSYLLFGISDVTYFQQGWHDVKARYAFWEVDKNFNTISKKTIALKDTSTYKFRIDYFSNPIRKMGNGDFIFTANENCFRYDNGLTDVFLGIYCVDSLYNLKWSYRIADTTYNDAFGLPRIEKIPNNPDEILWYSRWGDQPLMPTSEVWMRKIKVDGSNLGIEALSLDERKNFALYPNPAKNSCEILLPFLPSQPITIKVININGEIAAEHLHQEKSNLIQLSFDLPPGAYSLSLTSSEYQASQQLIIN